jgi:DNA-binding NtrC family response regulator
MMPHVLIADDETHTRTSLSFILESAGFRVTDASDGREAVDKISAFHATSCPIDLLVLDVEMPGFTGWQVLEALGRLSISIPTIIITGFSDDRTFVNPSRVWPLRYLAKPFTPELLTECVLGVLQKREPRPQRGKGETVVPEHSGADKR